MSRNLPPTGYRSWLHYTVEQVRSGKLTLAEHSLDSLEADLAAEDDRVARVAEMAGCSIDSLYPIIAKQGIESVETQAKTIQEARRRIDAGDPSLAMKIAQQIEVAYAVGVLPAFACSMCGEKHGAGAVHGDVAWHRGTCGICGKESNVTTFSNFRGIGRK